MTSFHMLCLYINTLWFYVSGIIEYTEIVFIFLTARNNNKCVLGLQCLVLGLSWAGNPHASAMSSAWSPYTYTVHTLIRPPVFDCLIIVSQMSDMLLANYSFIWKP